jgi:hypothetical protein
MPTDEIALTRATERAAQAEALMRNEMLQESFDGLITAYTKAWRGSTDMDERDRCWHRVQAIDEVRMRLTNVMSGGKLAQAELNKIAERRGS